ncbi:hypothetical protein B0T26DRAFT_404863 [Lasiosphaeria miniovina]|uniref:Uncharacterized protein n=1 Tax=Lasiosphaeria miniovina TaxID=1954250 RepID=A0AA40A4Y6_9PEZI|nr:uncharacterized protein B0T26DRAFT_404863 [Lasiosphaeria miniovina]KAK0709418.1 hypothetical protein B0T26DRAFT_404863 [Lasiosphaeria miniovina]
MGAGRGGIHTYCNTARNSILCRARAQRNDQTGLAKQGEARQIFAFLAASQGGLQLSPALVRNHVVVDTGGLERRLGHSPQHGTRPGQRHAADRIAAAQPTTALSAFPPDFLFSPTAHVIVKQASKQASNPTCLGPRCIKPPAGVWGVGWLCICLAQAGSLSPHYTHWPYSEATPRTLTAATQSILWDANRVRPKPDAPAVLPHRNLSRPQERIGETEP